MSERMDGWRECADPEELAAAVAAGVKVQYECDAHAGAVAAGRWHRNYFVTADEFAAYGLRYRVPASWTWNPEPVCRHCHGAGYIDTSAGTVACDVYEPSLAKVRCRAVTPYEVVWTADEQKEDER